MKLDCFFPSTFASHYVRAIPAAPTLASRASLRCRRHAAGPPSRSLCMPAAACLPPWSPRALAALEAAAVAVRLEAATLEVATA